MNNSDLEVKSASTVPGDIGSKPIVKRAAAKPRTAPKPKVSQPKKPLSEPSDTPEVYFIIEESPAEVVLDTIEILNHELVIDEEKKKKHKKSDLKKIAKRSTLCKLVKNDYLKKHFAEYSDLVNNPVVICKKCGRTANSPKLLCKPRLLNKQEPMDACAQL